MNFTQTYAPLSLSRRSQTRTPTLALGTSKWFWTKVLVLAGLLFSPFLCLEAQTSFGTSYDQHWSFETCDGHIWQIVYTYGTGSFGYLDLAQAASAQPAAAGTRLSSFATSNDQHWVFQTSDGHIHQIVYTYSNGRFSNDDLTKRANALPGVLYGGLSSFATSNDQHWVFQTSDGHIRQIVYTYSNGGFSNDDLTQRANALPGVFYGGLGSFATSNDQHWVFHTSDGHIRQIVYTYSNGGFSNDDLTQRAVAPASTGGLSAFATSTDQHWVFQTSDGHVRQIVYTYSNGWFSNDDLTQRANAQNALVGTDLGSFATSNDQHWVFETSDGHIRQIVYTYSNGWFSNDDLTQRANAQPAGLYCMAQ
jgi:hypothetical protein